MTETLKGWVIAIVVVAALLYGCAHAPWATQQRSEDQLFGCTIAQQAPNGECR